MAISSLDNRAFQQLLGAVGKHVVSAAPLPLDDLRERLAAAEDEELLRQELDALVALVDAAAREGLDVGALEERLAASQLSDAQRRVFLVWWRGERHKIHSQLYRQTSWNGHLERFTWRADTKVASRDNPEIGEPTAIFEMVTTAGHVAGPGGDAPHVARFELTRAQLGALLDQLREVEDCINANA
mmetsp:Transcript_13135/g.44425  ORF Transcript_13135/g.44425 Transcript_13135/m.44425 type:complete len:186 (+) Transcript_13135:179-736(+)